MQKNTGIADRSILGPRDLAWNETHMEGTFLEACKEFYDTVGEDMWVKTRNFDVEKIGMAKWIWRRRDGIKLWQLAEEWGKESSCKASIVKVHWMQIWKNRCGW